MAREKLDYIAVHRAASDAAGAIGAEAAVADRGENRLGHRAQRTVILADE
jgi:hypothetical protein